MITPTPAPGVRGWEGTLRVIYTHDEYPRPVSIPQRAFYGAEDVWCVDEEDDQSTGMAGWRTLCEATGSHLDVSGYVMKAGGWRLAQGTECPSGVILAVQRVCWTCGQVRYRFWMQGARPLGGG